MAVEAQAVPGLFDHAGATTDQLTEEPTGLFAATTPPRPICRCLATAH
jgi:hypothetical protein